MLHKICEWTWKGNWSGHSVDYSEIFITDDPNFASKIQALNDKWEKKDGNYYDDSFYVHSISDWIVHITTGEFSLEGFESLQEYVFSNYNNSNNGYYFAIGGLDEFVEYLNKIKQNKRGQKFIQNLEGLFFDDLDFIVDNIKSENDDYFDDLLFLADGLFKVTDRKYELVSIITNSVISNELREVAINNINDREILKSLKLPSEEEKLKNAMIKKLELK